VQQLHVVDPADVAPKSSYAAALRYDIAIGLWKGDLTLKRAITATMEAIRRDGFLRMLDEKYGIEPIVATIPPVGAA
jgi:ABC-type amino acid transport substrate-binding protein